MGRHSVVGKREKLCGSAYSDFRIGLAAGQAISAATRRRSARILGATASGLLGVTFFSAAVAYADNYDVAPDPTSTEVVTGLYGLGTALPAVDGSVQGHQVFDLDNTTLSQVVGTFDADQTASSDAFGGTNEELLVTSDLSGTAGTGAGDVPPVGSVLDTFTLGDTGYANIYSATPGADTISDTLITPSGTTQFPSPMTQQQNPLAIRRRAFSRLCTTSRLVPTVMSPRSADSPCGGRLSGSQEFATASGTFDEARLRRRISSGIRPRRSWSLRHRGVTGTAAGDVPPVGSVFNVLDTGFTGYDNVYSDIPSTTPGGADVITDTLVTPLVDFAIPKLLRRQRGDHRRRGTCPLGRRLRHHSGVHRTVRGNKRGSTSCTSRFRENSNSRSSKRLSAVWPGSSTLTLARLQIAPVISTRQSSLPPMPQALQAMSPETYRLSGRVFDTMTYGDSGFENIYTDLASTTAGADTITDTLVTPFGGLTIPTSLDVAAGLASDMFGSGL